MTANETIAERNDRIRKNAQFSIDHRHVLAVSSGVRALGKDAVFQLVADMVAFEDFTEDLDPMGLHDWGELEKDGTVVWFKIDEDATGRMIFNLFLPEEY
jgi:hypothetical protein